MVMTWILFAIHTSYSFEIPKSADLWRNFFSVLCYYFKRSYTNNLTWCCYKIRKVGKLSKNEQFLSWFPPFSPWFPTFWFPNLFTHSRHFLPSSQFFQPNSLHSPHSHPPFHAFPFILPWFPAFPSPFPMFPAFTPTIPRIPLNHTLIPRISTNYFLSFPWFRACFPAFLSLFPCIPFISTLNPCISVPIPIILLISILIPHSGFYS